MALSIALSVIATTGAGIVVGARIIFGMARYRALPGVLGTVNRRFATPAAATVLFGLLVVALAWVYLLATSVQNAFTDVVDITGLVFALFYVLTGLASHRLLPAADLLRPVGRGDPGGAADRVGRVPGLDGGQVPVDRARQPGLVDDRHPPVRPGHAGRVAFLAEVAVLRGAARERPGRTGDPQPRQTCRLGQPAG